MILIIPATNLQQSKTISNKEQGIMNKEVGNQQIASYAADCCIYTSKFYIPCSLFDGSLFNIHLDVLFFLAVSILLTKIEINWLFSSNTGNSFSSAYHFLFLIILRQL